MERAKFILSQAKGGPLATMEEVYARETYMMADMSPAVETVVQAARIGKLGIAALPCEVFVETGLAHQSRQPLPADLHDLAGQRLCRLPADGGASPAWGLRDLAGAVELSGGRGRTEDAREAAGVAGRSCERIVGWDKVAKATAGPPGYKVGNTHHGGPALANASWSHPTCSKTSQLRHAS